MRTRMTPPEKRDLIGGKSCPYCGCTNALMMTVDHIVPLSRGGADDQSNMQACCYVCNQIKGPLTHEEFLEYYQVLQTMHKLAKIKISNLPASLGLQFNQSYYPGFNLPSLNGEAQKKL